MFFRASHACSHPRVPRAHQAGLSRRSLPSVGLSESVRHEPGLALLTNGGKSVVALDETKKTVMQIWDRWMQVGTTDQRGRSHPPQCTTSREDRSFRRQWCDERRIWTAELNEVVCTNESRICLQHHDGRIRVWRHRGERMLNSCVMRPAPGVMVWGGNGYHSRTPLVRIAGTLNRKRYTHLRGVGASCPSLPSGLGHSHISTE
ncbi:transposable element Tcb1 transposase [Trichonephila clavipes]|nr:transposable element Tcb1 transposase [Trichonephila clavipes]